VAAIALSLITRLAIPQAQLLALVQFDGRLLLYALGIALVSGLLFGLAPAIQLLRENQTAAMGRSRRRWFQDLFVTAEVAGTLLLVVSTGLLLRSLWLIEQVQPGFDPRHVTTAFFMKPQNDAGFLDRLTTVLRSTGGIQSAALAYPVPFHGGGLTSSFGIKTRQPQPGEPEWHGEAYMITPGYLETLRIPLLRGRDLLASDAASSPLVCLIDSKFAQLFFPNQDPIGQEIRMYKGWARIVGVAGQIRATTLESASRPVVYYSLAQVPFFAESAIVARSSVSAAAAIREAVRAANSAVPLYDMKLMEERISESLGLRRVVVLLLGVFGSISLLLAAIGLYGVVAQVVTERTRETGIRMALGARPVQILSHYMGQGMRSGMAGLVIGLAAAIYSQRWITDMLYVVKPFDPISLCAASIGVVSVLLLAVWWPARRASRIAPQDALRCE
jgi:predicted permease